MHSTTINSSVTPELALQGLKQRVHALLTATSILEERARLEASILAVYRKAAVAQLLYNRYVIAVAGVQGVGKTTLLKQLYDLPEGYIPENIGRGEKLPVLITEHGGQDIRPYVRRAIKHQETEEYELKNQPVSQSDFLKTAQNPAETDMWLELMVPGRYFHNENTSFLLLPGMEQTTNADEHVWQDFMHHALTMASTCVLVSDSTNLAQANATNLIESMIRDFQSAKPIFTLSFSDLRNDKQNGELKSAVMERFSIPPHEENRVILSGTGAYSKEWRDRLIEAVTTYASIPRAFRRSQMKRLSNILETLEQEILPELLEQVEGYDTRIALQTENGEYYNAILKVYDQEAGRIRRAVDKQVRELLSAHQSQALYQIRSLISDRGWKQKAITFIFGRSYGEHRDFVQAIQDAWEASPTASTTVVSPSYLPFECSRRIQGIIQGRLGQNQLVSGENEPSLGTQTSSSSVAVTAPKVEVMVKSEIIDNIKQFFETRTSDGDRQVKPLGKEAAQLIPLIALERLNQSLMVSPFVTQDSKGNPIASRPQGQLWDQLKALSDLSPGAIVKGIGYVFGLELAEGAAINTVPALLGVLGIEATTLAVSVASGLCGLLTLGLVATTVTRQVAKQQFQDEDLAIALMTSFRETYHQIIMDHYEEFLMEARERLEIQIRKNLHIDDMFSRWERLRYAVSEVSDYQLKMREILDGHLDLLG